MDRRRGAALCLCLIALFSGRQAGAMTATSVPGAPGSSASPPPPLPAYQIPLIRGVLSKDVIRRVIFFHINEIRNCYQQELQMRPALQGRLVVGFVITDRGQVADLTVQKTTLSLPSLLLCVSEAMQKWVFPPTATPGVTVVTYPFVLRPRPPRSDPPGLQISDEELARLGVTRDPEPPAADILF